MSRRDLKGLRGLSLSEAAPITHQSVISAWYMQVLHMTDHNKPAWDVLHWATSTGDLAFEHTHQGLSEFEWLKANPAEEDKFSKAMKEVDSLGEACITPYFSRPKNFSGCCAS